MKMDVGELFRLGLVEMKRRKRAKIEEIAKACGVTPRHIQGVLSPKEKKGLGRDAQTKVAGFFGMSPADMLSLGMKLSQQDGGSVAPYHDYRPSRQVPLISWVRAGGWINPQAQTTPGHADEWIETTATTNENAFALTVFGDSMAPEFGYGDVVIVDPGRPPLTGSYVIAVNGDSEATFKQLVIDGPAVFLKPLNPRYPIREITGQDVRIVGVVCEKRKRY